MVHFSPLRLLLNCVKGKDLLSSLDLEVNLGGLVLAVMLNLVNSIGTST
jgi:hypothetical protein